MELDRLNKEILRLLQDNARISILEVSRIVKRAESTVRERIAGLERKGIIRGYQAILDPINLGYDCHAVVHATCDISRLDEVTGLLEAIPEVTRAYLSTGEKPLIIEILARDMHRLQEIIERDLAVQGEVIVEPAVIMRPLIERNLVPFGVNGTEASRETSDQRRSATAPQTTAST